MGRFRFRPYYIRIWGAWQELSIKNHDAKQNIGTFRCKQAQNWQAAQRKVLLFYENQPKFAKWQGIDCLFVENTQSLFEKGKTDVQGAENASF